MTHCTHRLYGGPLTCDRTTPHDPEADTGHTYTSSAASHLDDRHGKDSHA